MDVGNESCFSPDVAIDLQVGLFVVADYCVGHFRYSGPGLGIGSENTNQSVKTRVDPD
jgi:hypothetical protein